MHINMVLSIEHTGLPNTLSVNDPFSQWVAFSSAILLAFKDGEQQRSNYSHRPFFTQLSTTNDLLSGCNRLHFRPQPLNAKLINHYMLVYRVEDLLNGFLKLHLFFCCYVLFSLGRAHTKGKSGFMSNTPWSSSKGVCLKPFFDFLMECMSYFLHFLDIEKCQCYMCIVSF